MLKLIKDQHFVQRALDTGSIEFLVRGSIGCQANFMFAPEPWIEISRPTYKLRAYGENMKKEDGIEDVVEVFVAELVDEVIFPGRIGLHERTLHGVRIALHRLEQWADLLCIAAGNPKLTIEVPRPLNPVASIKSTVDSGLWERWHQLYGSLISKPREDRRRIKSALWWYRKACGAAHYSIFDSYTANWNCIEILCNVSGGKIKKGPEVNMDIAKYLKGKKQIKPGHIIECYKRFANYSIKEQVKDALETLINPTEAEQIVYQCFEFKPREEQLYQIRNDINHGNIRENSASDFERVYLRGTLLSNIVLMLLSSVLGYPSNMDINDMAISLSNPPWRDNTEERNS